MYTIKISSSKKSIYSLYRGEYSTRGKAEKEMKRIVKKYPRAKCEVIEVDDDFRISDMLKQGKEL